MSLKQFVNYHPIKEFYLLQNNFSQLIESLSIIFHKTEHFITTTVKTSSHIQYPMIQCFTTYFHTQHALICQKHIMGHQTILPDKKKINNLHHHKYVSTCICLLYYYTKNLIHISINIRMEVSNYYRNVNGTNWNKQ